MRTTLFVLSNFFVFAAAAMISDMMFPKRGRWFRFLALLCFAAVEIIWLELGTGLAGKLTFSAVSFVAGGIFVLTGAVWLVVNRRQLSQKIFSRRLLLVPVVFIISLLLGWVAGKYGFQGTHFCGDDLSYHATAAAQWYQQGDISMLKHTYNGYKWFNAELLSLWFLLPFGQDGLVFLAGLFWMVLTCTAAIVLMQTLDIDRQWHGPIIFAVFCTDIVLYQATWTFSAVDLAGPAMLLAALAILFSEVRLPSERQWSCILLAGLCAGFACGTKAPFILPCLILMVWIFFVFRNRLGIRFSDVFLFGIGAAAAGGFWYIRNLILTGNPFFPAEIGPFKGPLTREIGFSTCLLGWITQSQFDGKLLMSIIKGHLWWPPGAFVIAATGTITGIIYLVRSGPHRKMVFLLVFIIFMMLAAYLKMPFSAQNGGPESPLSIALRFIIGPFLLGLILFSLWLNTKSKSRWVAYGVYLIGVSTAFLAIPNAIKTLAAAASLSWFIFFHFYKKPLPAILFFPPFILMILTGGLFGVAVAFPVQQEKTDQRLYQGNRYMGINLSEAWRKINTLPAGSRITVFGPFAYTYYPLFGRHLQLQPWPLSADTADCTPLYKRWKTKPSPKDAPWWGSIQIMDTQKWLEHLLNSGAEYVLVQWVDDNSWPQAYEILRQSDIAGQIDSGSNWALWKMKR